MALVNYSFTAIKDTDPTGINSIPAQAVTVKDEYDLSPAVIYSDAEGASPISSPATNPDGVLEFWVLPGYYVIESGSRTETVLIDDGTRLAPASLINDAVVRVKHYKIGDIVDTAGRLTSGDGGGAKWKAIDATIAPGNAPNEYNIVTGNAVISFLHIDDGEKINVLHLGAKNDGTDTLAELDAIKVIIRDLGKTQYFPDGVYGISDRYKFADGGNTFMELGAYFKLLSASTAGGALSGPFPTQTLPITINRLEIDCNNLAGENGGGFGHKIGMHIGHYRARNVLHDATTFGGKALQFEGALATKVRIDTVDLENCSIGLDFGAVGGQQEVDIQIGAVSMRDVDVPVYTNDTSVSLPSNDPDKLDVTIQSLTGRNCGRLSWAGSTATEGGIIIGDRGGWLSINYLKIVNDKGGFGSTAYGGIGALVRGTVVGLNLGAVELVADCTALFDFNAAGVQSPSGASILSYATTQSVIHKGNLDYVVKTKTGGGSLGPCMLRGVSIDGTLASLSGIVDTNAAAYTTALMEVIDASNNFKSTGLRSLNKINALGNTLATTTGIDSSMTLTGSWTPIDSSGAVLVFTAATGTWTRQGDDVVLFGQVTYPVTADVTAAKIGGFPFTTANVASSRSGGMLNVSTSTIAKRLYPEKNATTTAVLTETSGAATNANCSAAIFEFVIMYTAA